MTEIKTTEKELAELKDLLKTIKAKVNETGGSKGQVWLFRINSRVYDIEKRIEDIKAGKIRIDEIPSEAEEVEKRITKIEENLKKTIEE